MWSSLRCARLFKFTGSSKIVLNNYNKFFVKKIASPLLTDKKKEKDNWPEYCQLQQFSIKCSITALFVIKLFLFLKLNALSRALFTRLLHTRSPHIGGSNITKWQCSITILQFYRLNTFFVFCFVSETP